MLVFFEGLIVIIYLSHTYSLFYTKNKLLLSNWKNFSLFY